MTELQHYLAEEVAEDLADGIITRREAMRRLGLLGVSGATASALLTGFTATAVAAAPEASRGRRRLPRTTRWTSGRRWRPRRSPSPAPAAR